MRPNQVMRPSFGSRLFLAFLVLLFAAGEVAAKSEPQPAPTIAEAGKRCPDLPIADVTDDMLAEALNVKVERVVNVKLNRNLETDDVCNMPSGKLARAFLKVENPKPDGPGEWAQQRAREQSVNGIVKPDGLYQGFVQRQNLLQLQRTLQPSNPSVAGIGSGQWSALGPGNIGGRIRAVAIHPTTTSTIFIGGVAGGIWKSTNSGASWDPVNDFMGNLAISSIVFDPSDANILYAGTGEGFFSGDVVRGFGIFKSTDGGGTWNLLANTNPTTASPDWYWVNRLAISGGVILAATRGGVYRSTDGGSSWIKTYSNISGSGTLDIRFDPNNSLNAVFGERNGRTGYSTDGGANWITPSTGLLPFSTGSGRVEVAYAKSVPGTVYASLDDANGGGGKIFKSIDGGVTWGLVSTPAHLGKQGWYDNAIWVDSTDANHLIVGGLDLWRSTNAGLNFTKISNWQYSPSSAHADHHAIVSDPGYDGSTNKRIYFGNDGGMYKANDISVVTSAISGNGWTNLNNGLAITQFYGGAGHASANPTKIAGGTQDNGSLMYTGTTTWSAMFGGDGGYSAADSVDGNYFYGEYTFLSIHRSTNGGGADSSQLICSGIGDANGATGYCGGTSHANFIAPFILDPNNNNRMLAGGLSLWQSINVKATTPTWAAIKPSIGSTYWENISSIAVAEGNSAVVWVGHNDGSVYQTSNGTAATPTWTQVRPIYNYRTALRILIDKNNPSVVYVTYGGYAAGNVWKTTNAGVSWTDISGSLPQVPVRGFAGYPLDANWLYAGTEVGVFASTDAGATWSAVNDGPANVSVDELFWFDNATLVAATHGRGMFKTTVSPPTFALSVSRTGSGRVTSADVGVDCGAVCVANYASGTVVNLTATPSPSAIFTGWSGGGCSGTGACSVTMNGANSVSASFTVVADFPAGGAMPAGWTQSAGSSATWSVTTGSTFSGTYGLQAGTIANGQTSRVSYTGTFNAGMISFARRVSSESNFDYLKFYIDGVLQSSWSGEVPWGVVNFAVTAGSHTIMWEYSKDASGSAGSDTAWVDEVYLPLQQSSSNSIIPVLMLLLLDD